MLTKTHVFHLLLFVENPRLEIGSLEQQLIQSYDPEEIRQLLSKLLSLPSGKSQPKPMWNVNSKVK